MPVGVRSAELWSFHNQIANGVMFLNLMPGKELPEFIFETKSNTSRTLYLPAINKG
jgi:hypothetical protein